MITIVIKAKVPGIQSTWTSTDCVHNSTRHWGDNKEQDRQGPWPWGRFSLLVKQRVHREVKTYRQCVHFCCHFLFKNIHWQRWVFQKNPRTFRTCRIFCAASWNTFSVTPPGWTSCVYAIKRKKELQWGHDFHSKKTHHSEKLQSRHNFYFVIIFYFILRN